METVCTGCGARLAIPDDKVPAQGAVQATCPRCKGKIVIAPKAAQPPVEPASYPAGWVERFEEGVPVALVLHDDDETARSIGQALVDMGYRISRAESLEEAQARLKFNIYDLVVLHEGFQAQGGARTPLLAFLNTLPMGLRRQMFVALVGAALTTGDRMAAFRESVNVTVAEDDLPSLGKILKNSIAEHEVFYKLFHETMRGLGRAQ